MFVEDESDVCFYAKTLRILEDGGQWPHAVEPEFIAASLGEGKQRVPGGKDAVRKSVRKLAAAGLEGVVRGIIDRDTGNAPNDGVLVLDRYSFENYLIDPLVVYAALLDADLPLPVVLSPPVRLNKVYMLPRFLGERRGYDLLHGVRRPWPRLNKGELSRAYNRLRMVPLSLKEVLERCVRPME